MPFKLTRDRQQRPEPQNLSTPVGSQLAEPCDQLENRPKPSNFNGSGTALIKGCEVERLSGDMTATGRQCDETDRSFKPSRLFLPPTAGVGVE